METDPQSNFVSYRRCRMKVVDIKPGADAGPGLRRLPVLRDEGVADVGRFWSVRLLIRIR